VPVAVSRWIVFFIAFLLFSTRLLGRQLHWPPGHPCFQIRTGFHCSRSFGFLSLAHPALSISAFN
jgi:hypothetical protein